MSPYNDLDHIDFLVKEAVYNLGLAVGQGIVERLWRFLTGEDIPMLLILERKERDLNK